VNKAVIPVIIILAVGLPTAYAITITLGGDPVIVNGILDLMGNRITNVGAPTNPSDATTKAYVDSAPSTDTLALLGCTDTQIAKFVGSAWTCTTDSDTTFDGTDFALSNQPCTVGQVVTGVDASGSVICVVDMDTTFDGTDFATSGQSCTGGQKATGVDASGNVICAVDIDTDTVGGLSCSTNQVARWDGSNWVCGTVSVISLNIVTLDSTNTVGFLTSIAIGTDGFPVISYEDFTNSALKLVHCTNESCSTFDTPVTVDNVGSTGIESSIAIGTDGFPVISYLDFTNGDLKVAHCENAFCSTGSPTITAVDFADSVGLWNSITIGTTDGFPVISYWDGTNSALKVIHCGNASCSTGNTITQVENTDIVGQYTSIAIGTDNNPVISYHDATQGELELIHCTNTLCSEFDTPVVLDTTNTVGLHTSIAIGSDGFPVISYYDQSAQDLKLVHCLNTSCLGIEGVGFDTPVLLDSTNFAGQWNSIAIGPDNFPLVSYRESINSDLKLVHCTNVSCSTFDTPVTLDSNNAGFYTSIAIGQDGFPVISYADSILVDLKFAKCTVQGVCADSVIIFE